MKYIISWRERPAASAKDYEAAHERVLEIFNKDWKMPPSFSMLQFVDCIRKLNQGEQSLPLALPPFPQRRVREDGGIVGDSCEEYMRNASWLA
jgi:hypothetical protein